MRKLIHFETMLPLEELLDVAGNYGERLWSRAAVTVLSRYGEVVMRELRNDSISSFWLSRSVVPKRTCLFGVFKMYDAL